MNDTDHGFGSRGQLHVWPTVPRDRRAPECTHRVLTTIGGLRSHLGLNFKTFWARGKLRDFTYELAGPEGWVLGQ